jgi:hypothetical protein
MRTVDDCTYQEYKDGATSAFLLWKGEPEHWSPEHVTNMMLSQEMEYSEHEPLLGASEFLFFLSIGEYEVRNDILEERIANGLGYHIYRYESMGRYKDDLTPEEIAEVEKDIAYIKSKIVLPEMNSYEDRNWKEKYN